LGDGAAVPDVAGVADVVGVVGVVGAVDRSGELLEAHPVASVPRPIRRTVRRGRSTRPA